MLDLEKNLEKKLIATLDGRFLPFIVPSFPGEKREKGDPPPR